MFYTHVVLTRDEWQKKRKNPPKWDVPKGISKVSVGDAIAAVHKPLTLETIEMAVQSFGMIDDDFFKRSNEAIGWVNKCTALKVLSEDDITKLGAFLENISLT